MNTKTKYMIPALVATIAFVMVAATPLATAGSDKMQDDTKHQDHKLVVDGFVGTLQLTDDTDKSTLKDMVTVSLSEASSGLDVIKGELTIIANENGEKFLVWKLKHVEKDSETGTKTKTIHIVDAANMDNTATITKEYDYMKDYSEKMTSKNVSTMSESRTAQIVTDSNDLQSQFVNKIQELQHAIGSGDSESVSQIRQELDTLKNAILQSIAT